MGIFFASAAVAPQGASRWHLNQIYCECEAFTVKLRRICRFCGKPISIHFLPGRVPGRKYFSGCKCGICSPAANKLCAQQPAKPCQKAPQGFFDRRKAAARTSCRRPQCVKKSPCAFRRTTIHESICCAWGFFCISGGCPARGEPLAFESNLL